MHRRHRWPLVSGPRGTPAPLIGRASVLTTADLSFHYRSFAYASEVTTAPNPGPKVEGIGSIGLPLSDRDAKELVSKCRQSPFGKGGDTIVDTEVRNSFELNPLQFTLSNPAWNVCISALLDIVYRELALNCGRQHVVPELYKLLLYEEGAFFRSHQDSEKTPGMFGTLVVSLPSEHQGGAVVLKHQKDEYRFDSARSSTFGTSFAAWYSDVFHEVQKVSGGYRLVLTCNLVQKGSSVPQKAPNSDGSQRLTQSLQTYSRGLEANLGGWPDFLAYSLEHTYSQAGLSLMALKGKDYSRVESLRSVCDKLGFELYLALKEKEINKDEECGSEEFNRSESLKYVHDLEGRSQSVTPVYDEINLLDEGAATDDEDYDESEHEGWTGNEGAPVNYWYRTSMVLIVPPSRKVDFSLGTGERNFTAALKLMRDYRARQPATDSYEAQQLKRLCMLCVKKTDTTGFGYSRYSYPWMVDVMQDDSERQCMEEIAQVTLERDWYDVYDTLPAKWKLTGAALEALGAYLGSRDQDADKLKRLRDLLHSQATVQDQFEALESFRKGTQMSTAPETAKRWLQDIGCNVLKSKLDSSSALRKDAGGNLAAVVIEYGSDLVDPVLAALERCTTPTVAAFVFGAVGSVTENGSSDKLQLLEKMLKHLWMSPFDFEGPEIRTPKPNSWARVQENDFERDVLTADELVRLLEITQQYGGMPAFDALPVLCLALPKVSSAYAKEQVLPFIERIIKRKVSVLFPHDTRTPNGAVTELVRDGLTAIIANHVEAEPQRATNFALPRGTCSCSDCQVINNFLVSQQTQLQVPMRRKEKKASTPKIHRQREWDV